MRSIAPDSQTAASRRAIAPFRAHPLIRGGHAQTILGVYLTQRVQISGTTQHQLTLPDGDRLVLHDDCPPNWTTGQRVVLQVHGLGGSHASPYMQRLTSKLLARGVRSFRLDMRGYGAGYALAKHPGHAGRSEDVAATIQHIEALCPGSPLSLIGYSLGGNISLKLAGECGAAPPGGLDSVAAICPPIDLSQCSANIGRGLNFIYDRTFVSELVALVERRRRELPHFADEAPLAPRPRNLLEFDDRYTAIQSGFRGASEYYARCSSSPLLSQIKLPTLLLAASDDPLIPAHIFAEAKLSPNVNLHLAPGGGHLGFIGRSSSDPDRRWLDWRLLEWVESCDR